MDFQHFWAQGDLVSHGVALMLGLLSVLSWAIIGTRLVRQWRLARSLDGSLEAFWAAPTLEQAVDVMGEKDASGVFAGMARTALHLHTQHVRRLDQGIASGLSASEMLTRGLRNYMVQAQARIENGLTFLASVGSTAPFIGLLGTVWGVYHALLGLAGSHQVVLDQVAGPVGEALIMTAAGLFVAIPAVLAYNALTRANRLTVAYLDGFAHDLHAYLTTGARLHLVKAA